jgi:murein L,D-transpeptidase YcbB/YkuD
MKWNKRSFILVAAVFLISYLYNLYYNGEMSQKIEKQRISACKAQKQNNCDLIELFHNACFKKSYRSYMKAMHFYNREYEACLREKIKAFQKK